MLVTVPKEKRIRNRALLEAMKEEIPYCERCGKPGHGGMHHIRYRSQGGSDIRENLIRLCMYCHRGIHDARYDRTELIVIVARREGVTPEEVADSIGIIPFEKN